MNKLKKIQLETHDLLRKDVGQALQRMYEVTRNGAEVFKAIISEDNEWRRLKVEQLEDRVAREDYIREARSQVYRIASLIDELKEEDIAEDLMLREEFRERILVICQNETREQYLQKFFQRFYFPNLEFDVGGRREDKENYDLLIFDNLSASTLEEDGLWMKLLESLLANSESPFLLYLGKWEPILEGHTEKVYATNFIFSIYARIKEMSEFIRFYKEEN